MASQVSPIKRLEESLSFRHTHPSETISRNYRQKNTPKLILQGTDTKTKQRYHTENYMPTSLMNIVAKILNKIQQTESNNTLKGSYTMIKWDLSRDARIFLFKFFAGVQMIDTVVIVSSGQEKDSAIHIHVSIPPQTPLHSGCHIILSRVPLYAESTKKPIGKDPDAGRDWGQEEKGTTEDEMAG